MILSLLGASTEAFLCRPTFNLNFTCILTYCIVILSILGASTEAYPTFKLNLVWWYPFFFTKAFLQTFWHLKNVVCQIWVGHLWRALLCIGWAHFCLKNANKETVPFVFQAVGSFNIYVGEFEKMLSFHPTYVCQSQLLPALEISILTMCFECEIFLAFFGMIQYDLISIRLLFVRVNFWNIASKWNPIWPSLHQRLKFWFTSVVDSLNFKGDH